MWIRLLTIAVLGAATGGAAVWFALGRSDGGTELAPVPHVSGDRPIDAPAALAATQPSLAGFAVIVANARDFQRNTELYALLADTTRGEVEALLGELDALAPAPHRYDVARVLYTRFAELDPDAAADHVTAAKYHSSWVATVFRAWAHADVDAAVERAATLEDDAKAIAVEAILELDLTARQRADVADRLGGGMVLATIEAREAMTGGQTDFAAAWQAVLRNIDVPQSPSLADARSYMAARQYAHLLARRWASEDPVAAMTAVAGADRESIAMSAQMTVVQVWARDDPYVALAWLADQQEDERDGNLRGLVQIVMHQLAGNGVGEALATLDSLPANLREHAAIGLVGALRNDAATDRDFHLVLDWYESLDSKNARVARELSRAYATHDPEQALAWAQKLHGRARSAAVNTVTSQLARTDPALAKRLIGEMEDGRLRMNAAQQFISQQLVSTTGMRDPKGMLQWARSFPVEADRGQLERQTFTVWSVRAPRDAIREVLAIRDAERRDELAATVAWSIVRRDAELAEELFEAVESESARRTIANVLLRHYTETKPDERKADFYRRIAPERQSRGGRQGQSER